MSDCFRKLVLRPLLTLTLAAPCLAQAGSDQELRNEIAQLRAVAQNLQARIDGLEKRLTPSPAPTPEIPATAAPAPPTTTAASTPGLLGGTTVNFGFDGYYGYNF